MIAFVNIILLVVNIISFIIVLLFSVFGIYEQIMGPADSEKMLQKLHIPLNYHQTLILGFVSLIVMLVCYTLRAKLSGDL